MSNYNYNTLCHHGIKGQKWGIRRFQNEDGTLTEEGKQRYGDTPNRVPYDDSQYLRDKSVYSKSAANRINQRTLNGYSVQGARSIESSRIENYRYAANVSGKVHKVAGTIIGAIGAYGLANKYVNTGRVFVDDIAIASIALGGAQLGGSIGKKTGEAIPMLAGGYKPSKKH